MTGYYDENEAQKVLKFFSHLTHTKGRWASKQFKLLPWQQEPLLELFSTKNSETGYRQYRTAFWEVPKKQGKSETAAAVALKLLCADGEQGAEIVSAAADREQASIVFNVAAQMVRNWQELHENCKILDSQKRIIYHPTSSYYHALSSETATKHGYNLHGVIFDEIHAQPNRELWDVLTLGSGAARTQPLVFAITTAGFDRNSICYELHDYARKVAKGIVDDPTFYPLMYVLEDNEDWEDEKNWASVNPSLGHIFDIDEIRTHYKRAKETPAQENNFRRLRLDQWTSQENRWLPMDKWKLCDHLDKVNIERLRGRPCYGGLDLSQSYDLSAYVLVFPEDDESYTVIPYFWIPDENIMQRINRDRVPYDVWVRQGHIQETPGNIIDYSYILHVISESGKMFDVREIAFDRWGAVKLMQDLQELGFMDEKTKHAKRHLIEFGQGYASMNSPTKELLKLVLEERINHGNNPVLTWMADNLVVKLDPAGNVKPDKEKSSEKIDGIVAMIMGLDRALKMKGRGSKYENGGLLII